jgi:hypothetical protein
VNVFIQCTAGYCRRRQVYLQLKRTLQNFRSLAQSVNSAAIFTTFVKKKILTPRRKIFVALPLMDELENIPALLKCFREQTFRHFEVVICVNQPDSWWHFPDKREICKKNQATIELLHTHNPGNFTIIDRSTPGKGWDKKHHGVGWARKTAMDHVSRNAANEDIILTLDGDTFFSSQYFETIAAAFDQYPDIKALAVPYYHPLPDDDEAAARAILRYEIYMRHYAINMLRTGNPYAFTALGSAIASTVRAYRSIDGITPHKSGEDFYFVQKLRKFGAVLIWIEEQVYPAARFSDRVFFGTGPAMIRGSSGDWSGYPIYPDYFFDEVKTTFDGFPQLYNFDIELPMTTFLIEKFGETFWQPLRANASAPEHFTRACKHKVDGLRILQYLKWRNRNEASKDGENLMAFFTRYFTHHNSIKQTNWKNFSFEKESLQSLNFIRDLLTQEENLWRKKIRVLR